MKKQKGISLGTVLKRQLKDKEFKFFFDERRFYLQFAHLVADLRERSGMSQAALAKAAGVSQSLIARLEVGDKKRAPSFHMVFKVIKALGYNMEISVK
jgi:DNA-binding XRE family transcriptional regulator